MLRNIFLFSIFAFALVPTSTLAAEPASTSVESAGYQQVAAPGALLSAFGTGFPLGTAINERGTDFPLPTAIEGVSLLVNSVPAPLLCVFVTSADGNFQINYQLPWEATGNSTVEVFFNGTRVSSELLTVDTAAPGLFSVDASGLGQVAAQNYVPSSGNAYSPNGSGNPIPQGEVLIFYAGGTGFTLDQNSKLVANPATGEAAPNTPLYVTTSNPTVTIGGKEAQVLFSGLAPGFVGLWQINVKVDNDTPVGDSVPVVIEYKGKSTREGLAVAVREGLGQPTTE